MSPPRQLNELAERRRLLVMEADLHRNLIGLERASLRAQLADLRLAREGVTANKPLLLVGGVLAGWLAVRHAHKLARWLPTALTAWRWLQSLKGK